ncbi:hypothetical protein B0H19DRAFT_1095659 [Mycena capillaripes]|nr:hypothetical protein B0H19DRAFT_1095659 [Mycena capillaripes]
MNAAPTLDNLRVKTCFICLEEERAPELDVVGRPNRPARNASNAWVHPCSKCALVAHDQCLRRWMSSLPAPRPTNNTPARAYEDLIALRTLKCPHCRRPYELVTPPSWTHGLSLIYNGFYVLLAESADVVCTAVGVSTFQMIPFGISFQLRLIALSGMFLYEVAFLESYLGPRMFDLLMIKESKHLLRSLSIVVPTIPFRLLLPGTLPKWIIPFYLCFPIIFQGITELGVFEQLDSLSEVSTSHATISTWPPSPALLGLVIVPLIRPIYNRLFSHFSTWVLGAPPPHRQRRYLSERLGARARGLFNPRTLFGFGARRAPRPVVPPAAPPNLDVEDPDPPPLLLADQVIQKDQSSLSHDVLHAVCSIAVPRLLGTWLRAAAGYSSHLQCILGLRTGSPVVLHAYEYPNWTAMTLRHRALAVSQTVGGLLLGCSWVWGDVDPVWWRNSLGYGIFVLAKDCFELYRLWLQKQEVESRTIQSRDFAGVDIAALDLISPERFL